MSCLESGPTWCLRQHIKGGDSRQADHRKYQYSPADTTTTTIPAPRVKPKQTQHEIRPDPSSYLLVLCLSIFFLHTCTLSHLPSSYPYLPLYPSYPCPPPCPLPSLMCLARPWGCLARYKQIPVRDDVKATLAKKKRKMGKTKTCRTTEHQRGKHTDKHV